MYQMQLVWSWISLDFNGACSFSIRVSSELYVEANSDTPSGGVVQMRETLISSQNFTKSIFFQAAIVDGLLDQPGLICSIADNNRLMI